jgi:hypothetical protein
MSSQQQQGLGFVFFSALLRFKPQRALALAEPRHNNSVQRAEEEVPAETQEPCGRGQGR